MHLQIKAAMEELQKEVMALGQAVYGQQQGGAAPGADAGAGAAGSSSGPKGDDVIDAGELFWGWRIRCVDWQYASCHSLHRGQLRLLASAHPLWTPLPPSAEFTDSDKK